MSLQVATSFNEKGRCPDFRTIPAVPPSAKASEILIETIKDLQGEGMDVFVFAGNQMLV